MLANSKEASDSAKQEHPEILVQINQSGGSVMQHRKPSRIAISCSLDSMLSRVACYPESKR